MVVQLWLPSVQIVALECSRSFLPTSKYFENNTPGDVERHLGR